MKSPEAGGCNTALGAIYLETDLGRLPKALTFECNLSSGMTLLHPARIARKKKNQTNPQCDEFQRVGKRVEIIFAKPKKILPICLNRV